MDVIQKLCARLKLWHVPVILAGLLAYAAWFTGATGPYGRLSALTDYTPLQETVYYSGPQAVAQLKVLKASGYDLKMQALLFDLPYMLLHGVLFLMVIVLGMRQVGGKSVFLLLPLIYIAFDLGEGLALAATMVSGSESLGAVAGVLTLGKFISFVISALVALGMAFMGGWFWFKRRKT